MIPGALLRVYIEVRWMISLTKMNQHVIVINSDQIEVVESTPDTVITLVNGHKYIVNESVSEVVDKIVLYKHRIFNIQK